MNLFFLLYSPMLLCILTHCLVLKKVDGWKAQRKESFLKFGFPPFGCFVRKERKLVFGGSHVGKPSLQDWAERRGRL
jgi:hypothetical protein